MESIINLIQVIKGLTFFQRIFQWKKVTGAMYDALEEITRTQELHKRQIEEIESLARLVNEKEHAIEKLQVANDSLKERLPEKEMKAQSLEEKLKDANSQISELKEKVLKLNNLDENRKAEHAQSVQKLEQSRDGFEKYKEQLHEQQLKDLAIKHEQLKKQWSDHQNHVEEIIKGLCQRHIIEYASEVPFRGSPDNAIKICEEYVIFDAKSPAGHDHSNFPTYLKNQVEQAKKYAGKEGVRSDIYLVIPSSTVEVVKEWSYNLGNYRVFIITPDALEPVLLSLKKLEDYEFVDQLSPEERENIARIIGKFAHTTKRRIQVDQYFASHFLDLLKQCEVELPEGIQEEILEFEKAEKLNPPMEKRKKQILLDKLVSTHEVFSDEVRRKEIEIPEDISMQSNGQYYE